MHVLNVFLCVFSIFVELNKKKTVKSVENNFLEDFLTLYSNFKYAHWPTCFFFSLNSSFDYPAIFVWRNKICYW